MSEALSKKLAKKHSLESTSEKFPDLSEYSRDALLHKVRHILPEDTHYQLGAECNLIRSSLFDGKTKEQLIWLYQDLQDPEYKDALVSEAKSKYALSTRTLYKIRIGRLEKVTVKSNSVKKHRVRNSSGRGAL